MGDFIYGDFEWDEARARYNLRAHGVSFLEAMTVFDDPLAVVKESRKHSVGEYRYGYHRDVWCECEPAASCNLYSASTHEDN